MNDPQTLISNISKIPRDEFSREANQHFDDLVIRIQSLEVARLLGENYKLKELFASYREQIKQIETSLLTKKSSSLDAGARDNMIDKKILLENFILSFDASSMDDQLALISKEIDSYLYDDKPTDDV